MYLPALSTTVHKESDTVAMTFHVALGDIVTSVRNHKGGLLTDYAPCLYAGIDYYGPWTRDASLNIWNGAGLLMPEVARNTLLSVLNPDKSGRSFIDGEYWDCMLFVTGAWEYYLQTGDKPFLKTVLEASVNTLRQLEENEFDPALNLFRGGAFFQDGISAYPALYSKTGVYTGGQWVANIKKWVEENPALKVKKGFGLPMFALSSNCIYYRAYTLLPLMQAQLGQKPDPAFARKALQLKEGINRHFWMPAAGNYRYLLDPNGNADRQESAGLAFAVLFGIAGPDQQESVFRQTYVAPAGIPCIYPSFERYSNLSPGGSQQTYARHSGTVWPHVQGLWALAAASGQQEKHFMHEFTRLTRHAFRDKQFREIYHPLTGLPYGGMQEDNTGRVVEWKSTERQVWSATAYLSMVLKGVFGMELRPEGILFKPMVSHNPEEWQLRHLRYRQAELHIVLKGEGRRIKAFTVNGKKQEKPFLPAAAKGRQRIEIEME
jgi:glycogen debranching enzyme